MSSGNWLNKDGLYLKFGTSKADVEVGGDYKAYGSNRIAEVLIDLSKLNTSTATIVSDTLRLPAMGNFFVESVEAVAEVGMSTASSPTLSVGVINADRATVPSNGGTAFISSAAAATLSTAGNKLTLVAGSTAAGNYIGDYQDVTNLTSTGLYITAKLGTATATGMIRVRVLYHGVGTISQ